MSPGQIGEAGGGDTAPVGAEGSVQDAGPGDQSFAFPQDFEQVGDAVEAPEPAEPAQEAPPAAQPGQAPQAARPAQAPAAGSPPPPAPQQRQQEQPAAPPAQPARQPGAQPQQPPTPNQLVERLAANRDALVNDLASNRFRVTLSDQEKTALEQDAIAALPNILSRLGAQLYYETVVTSLNQIANFVPRLAQQVAEQSSTASSAENAFYQRWNGFDRANAEHSRVINHFANSYRQMNPNASLVEAIDNVGKMSAAYLGIQLQQGNGARQPAGRQPSARPFAPAGGGRVVTPVQSQDVSPWGGLGMDFDE